MGQGVARVERQGLPVQADARLDLRGRQLVEVEASEQVKLVGFDVVGFAPVETLLRRALKPQRQRVGHVLRDRVLHGEHVRETLVEDPAPPRGAVCHVDEPGVDPDAIPGALHVAF